MRVADPDLRSAKGGGGGRGGGRDLTMNVEFCLDNSGTSKKMRYFRIKKWGPLDPPLDDDGKALSAVLTGTTKNPCTCDCY